MRLLRVVFRSISYFPIRDSTGEVTMVAELIRDITENRRLERELRLAKRGRRTGR